MRKSIALKTLLRSPLKTILTFLLITSASFALFSRVTDYAVTTRETANAESFYHGVAALDDSVPNLILMDEKGDTTFGMSIGSENKPWPTDEELKKLSSLPGVTLADTRYMTAGQIEDYRRMIDKEGSGYVNLGTFVLEGTYLGYDEDPNTVNYINLKFDDVIVHAGELQIDPENPVEIRALSMEETGFGEKNPYSQSFFDKLEKGSRCLIVGSYNDASGDMLEMESFDPFSDERFFCVLDGVRDNYLETEEFADYKLRIDDINQNLYSYDIVYTSDMRAIPWYNERSMVIEEGRPLTAEDTDVCVVSTLFLETHHLSIGDTISVKLGDQFFRQNAFSGAAINIGKISNFVDTKELKIVGAYRFVNTIDTRVSESDWSYTVNTVFVPGSLLPVQVPDDYKTCRGEFSILVENAKDIEAFRDAAEPLVAELGLNMRFSDGGWLSMKDSFEAGSLTSLLTTVLYIAGAALALFLAVYLYIGRNKMSYAVMRTLGVPERKARNSVVLPFGILSLLAVPIGGTAGLFYASNTAKEALEKMAASAPYGYVLDTSLPVDVIILCLSCELIFALFITLIFLRKMKNTPPLELLQGGTMRVGASVKAQPDITESVSIPKGLNITKVSTVSEMPVHGKYNAFRHVTSYIFRHIRRSIGKAFVSFVLASVLTAGIGMFVLAKLTYQDAFYEMDVMGRALGFSSSSVMGLSKSPLVKDFYCYGKFSVRINDMELHTPMTFTNDFKRYLADDDVIKYAEGYDASSMEGTGALCLIGQTLAENLNIHDGDEISLLADNMYYAMFEMFGEDEDKFLSMVEKETTKYKVAGIINSEDENVSTGIFASVNDAAEYVYGQPFPFEYSEFILANNNKLEELNRHLKELEASDKDRYAPGASFYIDSTGLKNIDRIRNLLDSLFPVAMTAILFIGLFGPGLVIMQSSQEAAFLRILGVTKKRARCMLVLEQVILCIVGIAFVICALALYSPDMFVRSVQTLGICFAMYLLSSICGALIASVWITKHRILEHL